MIKTIKNKYKKFVVDLRIYSLNITIVAAVLLIFVFLGATSYLYMHSETALNTQKVQREYFKQKATGREWMRIYKEHGYPSVVIYKKGETPYFYDKQGSKYAFIYPSKGAGLIVYQAEKSEYYAALTLNKEQMIK